MNNSFGNHLSVTLFGESHGDAIGIVLDGISPGIPVDEAMIAKYLQRRRPIGTLETGRAEPDHFSILSGVFNAKTTGTPLCIVIANEDAHSEDYSYGIARPSHADYTGYMKYHGFEDYRGGGHFSGRLTAVLTAAGGILIPALEKKGISIACHLVRCGGAEDRFFDPTDVLADITALNRSAFPALNKASGERMQREIEKAKESGDSIGGTVECAIAGLPAGIGEPWFDTVEGMLSHALFGIGGVKGIEFGDGFAFADGYGSEKNDAMYFDGGIVKTRTNHSGGICGGITNGMPVIFRVAVKPTPSIPKSQETVDFIRKTDTVLSVGGRHDPAIVRRVCPVIEAVSAIVISDFLIGCFGSDALKGE